MIKKLLIPLALFAVCLIACGCFGGNQTDTAPSTTTQPDASANPGQDAASTSPQPSANAGGNQQNANDGQNASGANNQGQDVQANGNGAGYDWATGAGAVEDRINMFSEIQDCVIVESENTALVGVEFTDAYQGEMTQRIRDMVAGEVMAADSAIQVVAVTSETDDVNKIRDLASQISSGNTPQDLKQQVDMIARNTTTLR
ncbi:MAG: YhcN/YlaJ family sporulation lipoprotein [Clostridia bacterium]|nr:YhcN/YlaJ family sporulation lipoprotein [Clostridia bacterium]